MRRGFSFPSRAAFRYSQASNIRGLAERCKVSNSALRPAALMGFTDTLRRFTPTKQVVNAFPHHRAHVPFVRIQLAPDRFHRAEPRDDSVLFGQRDSSPEMDSASGLRSRLWSPSTWAEG